MAATTDRTEEFDDLRKLKRRHLIYYLEVFDNKSGKLLGHLADLTTEGIKLVSREPIPTGEEFTLKMIVPHDTLDTDELVFTAASLWCRPDVNPDFHATGFAAPDLDEATKELFTRLIQLMGFND